MQRVAMSIHSGHMTFTSICINCLVSVASFRKENTEILQLNTT